MNINHLFKKFCNMGFTSLSIGIIGGSVINLSVDQGYVYDYLITQPVDAISHFIGQQSEVKNKFKGYIESDKKFLYSMGAGDVRVIYKYHQDMDKIFYPLMKAGQFIKGTTEEQNEEMESRYLGKENFYSPAKRDFIMLGINALENAGIAYYGKTFGEDPKDGEQKVTSFIFFHEYGHKYSMDNHILEEFDKKIKKLEMTPEEKELARSQFLETYADSFALMMLVKKYPDIPFKGVLKGVAKLRSEEVTHFTTPGLLKIKKVGRDLNQINSLSFEAAHVTLQYYLDNKESQEMPMKICRKNL